MFACIFGIKVFVFICLSYSTARVHTLRKCCDNLCLHQQCIPICREWIRKWDNIEPVRIGYQTKSKLITSTDSLSIPHVTYSKNSQQICPQDRPLTKSCRHQHILSCVSKYYKTSSLIMDSKILHSTEDQLTGL